jgi:hypothetical protein
MQVKINNTGLQVALNFHIQVLDFIISTGTCIFDILEGFQRRGTQKNTTL